MKALIVEDDELSLRVIAAILQKNSFEVEKAVSGIAALKFLEDGNIVDIIISDVMMPKMDGFTFAHQVRINRRLNRIPIILCTSLNDKKSIVKGIELGIADYVVKPIKEPILIPKVKKAIGSGPGAILVVDDEEIIRGIICRTLINEGYHVIEASNGNEIVDKLKENKISMVISDIKMPKMDGFELLAYVKELDPDMPVLLMSGHNEFSQDDVVSAGANGFIQKPFRNTDIILQVLKYYRK